MDAPAFAEGGCACGGVRYRVSSAPMIVHACHCRLCQRQTGSSHAVNALIEADRVIVGFGRIEHTLLDTPSGRGQLIARCADCKTALWSNYLAADLGENLRFLRVGTLDEPGLMPADVHIYAASKLPWLEIGGNTPVKPAFYKRKEIWSKDSLQRLELLSRKAGAAAGS